MLNSNSTNGMTLDDLRRMKELMPTIPQKSILLCLESRKSELLSKCKSEPYSLPFSVNGIQVEFYRDVAAMILAYDDHCSLGTKCFVMA